MRCGAALIRKRTGAKESLGKPGKRRGAETGRRRNNRGIGGRPFGTLTKSFDVWLTASAPFLDISNHIRPSTMKIFLSNHRKSWLSKTLIIDSLSWSCLTGKIWMDHPCFQACFVEQDFNYQLAELVLPYRKIWIDPPCFQACFVEQDLNYQLAELVLPYRKIWIDPPCFQACFIEQDLNYQLAELVLPYRKDMDGSSAVLCFFTRTSSMTLRHRLRRQPRAHLSCLGGCAVLRFPSLSKKSMRKTASTAAKLRGGTSCFCRTYRRPFSAAIQNRRLGCVRRTSVPWSEKASRWP